MNYIKNSLIGIVGIVLGASIGILVNVSSAEAEASGLSVE